MNTVDTIDVVTNVVTMASLRLKPNSKYWIACFTSANGQRAQRSTKTTNRKLAQKLADDYESAARSRMTEAQVRRVLTDLHRMHSGTILGSTAARSYFEQWVKAKAGTVAESTRVAYESAIRDQDDFDDFASDCRGANPIGHASTASAFATHFAPRGRKLPRSVSHPLHIHRRSETASRSVRPWPHPATARARRGR